MQLAVPQCSPGPAPRESVTPDTPSEPPTASGKTFGVVVCCSSAQVKVEPEPGGKIQVEVKPEVVEVKPAVHDEAEPGSKIEVDPEVEAKPRYRAKGLKLTVVQKGATSKASRDNLKIEDLQLKKEPQIKAYEAGGLWDSSIRGL